MLSRLDKPVGKNIYEKVNFRKCGGYREVPTPRVAGGTRIATSQVLYNFLMNADANDKQAKEKHWRKTMASIYCKTADRNFAGGVDLHSLFSKSGKHSYVIREVKLKLPAYVEYVEREEGVCVLDKTISKGDFRIGEEKRRKSRAGNYNWRSDNLATVL